MRYLRLLHVFYRNALIAEMEYRANFVVNFALSLFWIGFAILGLRVFYYHRAQIGTWNYHEAMLVVGCYSLFNGFIETLLQPNITRIVEQIREGTFDYVLIKPVNSQFMASMRHLSVWKLADVLAGILICIYALRQLQHVPAPFDLVLALALLVNGAVIVYAIWMLLVTTAFWFIRVDNITELFNSFFETGRFPAAAYPRWLRGVLTFVVPIILVTTVPAQALLGRAGLVLLLVAMLMAAVLLSVSILFWRYALRHYSSASS